MVKLLLRFFSYLLIILFTAIVTLGALGYIFRDRVVDRFIKEANKRLEVAVQVQEISLDPFSYFPLASVKMENLRIKESIPKSEINLLEANEAWFSFSPLKLLQGVYELEQISVIKGKALIRTTQAGTPNYKIWKETNSGGGDSVSVNLRKVLLTDTDVSYVDEKNRQSYSFLAHDFSGSVNVEGHRTEVQFSGSALCHFIKIAEETYFQKKEVESQGRLTYERELLTIHPSSLNISGADFDVSGNADFNTDKIDFSIDGKNGNIQTLLAFVPAEYSAPYREYRSQGQIYFDSRIFGSSSAPRININFGSSDATVYIPHSKKQITNLNFSGSFDNGYKKSQQTSVLSIANLSGKLDGNPLTGSVKLSNLVDPYLEATIQTRGGAQLVKDFVTLPEVSISDGTFELDVSFAGKIDDLEQPEKNENWKASGEVLLSNIDFAHDGFYLPFRNISGSLIFNNNDLAVSDLSLDVGPNDFTLNGFFRNLAGFIFQDKPIIMESDITSNYIDVETLLLEDDDQSAPYKFSIDPRIYLDFQCEVKKIKFQRFTGRDLRGELYIADQIAEGKNISLQTMGGKINLNGTVEAKDVNRIQVTTLSDYQNIYIDSVFYVFKNWGQDWLVDQNLKGKTDAEIEAYMEFDSLLNFQDETLQATLETTVTDGRLINFQPMLELSKYVEEEKLENVRFSPLKNQITIDNRTIYLPEMEIESNISTIKLYGTHTFDMDIDYHFQVPLKDFRKPDKDARYGQIAEEEGYSVVYLQIVGNTEDYEIKIDQKATLQSLKEKIKAESKDLKNLFRNRKKAKQNTRKLSKEEIDFNQ